MDVENSSFKPRAAVTCLVVAFVTAVIGLTYLPFTSGYFALALVAGCIAGIGWVIVIKTEGRSAMGYGGLLATVVLQIFAKTHFLSADAPFLGYPVTFVAISIVVGLGMPLAYREIKNRN